MKRISVLFGFGLRMSQIGLAFLTNVLLARVMGPDRYGLFVFILSWLMLLAGMLRVGLSSFLLREVAAFLARRDVLGLRYLLDDTARIVATATLIIVASLAGVALWLGGTTTGQVLAVGIPTVPALVAMTWWDSLTRGTGFVTTSQVAELLVRPFCLLLCVGVVVIVFGRGSATAMNVMTCVSIASVLAAILAFVLRPSGVVADLKNQVVTKVVEKTWRKGLATLTLVAWVGLANQYVILIIMGFFSPDAEVAFFSLAVQFGTLLTLGVTVMNTIQAADFSRFHVEGDRTYLQRMASRGATISFTLAVAGAMAYVLLDPWLINTFLGEEYEGVGAVLYVVAIGSLVNALSGSAGSMMNAFNQESTVFRALLLALAINIVFSLVLIPKFGAMGAAVAFTASVAAWNLTLIWKVYRLCGLLSLPFTAWYTPRET